jgi:hypothetical protein
MSRHEGQYARAGISLARLADYPPDLASKDENDALAQPVAGESSTSNASESQRHTKSTPKPIKAQASGKADIIPCGFASNRVMGEGRQVQLRPAVMLWG